MPFYGEILREENSSSTPRELSNVLMNMGYSDAVSFHGSRIVGGQPYEVCRQVRLLEIAGSSGFLANGSMAQFVCDEFSEVYPRTEANNPTRLTEYLLCAPHSFFPFGASAPTLRGEVGAEADPKSRMQLAANSSDVSVEIRPRAVYGDTNPNAGEQRVGFGFGGFDLSLQQLSERLLLSSFQPSLQISGFFIDDEIADRIANGVIKALSLYSGVACFWHTQHGERSDGFVQRYIQPGDTSAMVPFSSELASFRSGETVYQLKDLAEAAVTLALNDPQRLMDFSKKVSSYTEIFRARTIGERLLLAAIFLEDCSRHYPKKVAFGRPSERDLLKKLTTHYPGFFAAPGRRSRFMETFGAGLSKRLSAWANDSGITYNDLGDAPFRGVVGARNSLIHPKSSAPDPEQLELQLFIALTIIERFILKQLGLNDSATVQRDAYRLTMQNL